MTYDIHMKNPASVFRTDQKALKFSNSDLALSLLVPERRGKLSDPDHEWLVLCISVPASFP